MAERDSNGTSRALRTFTEKQIIMAYRLGRGDVQEDIADDVGVTQGSVSSFYRRLKRIAPDVVKGYGRRKRRVRIEDPAGMDRPTDLSTPTARVWAYILNSDSPHTRRAYAVDAEQIRMMLGLDTLADLLTIEVQDVVRIRDKMKAKGYAGGTIRRKMTFLWTLLDRETRLGYRTGVNPADPLLVRWPKGEPRSTLDVLTPDEVRKVLATCEVSDHEKNIRDAALLRVAFWCGLRAGELAGMTAAQPADWQTKREGAYFLTRDKRLMLSVVGKGEKAREMPVGDELREAVQRYLDRRGMDWTATVPLWRPTRGRKSDTMDVRSIRRVIKSRMKAAGIKKNISTHSTRKTAATRLLNLGVDLERVRHFLGHASIMTTQRYLRIGDDLDNHAAHKMAY